MIGSSGCTTSPAAKHSLRLIGIIAGIGLVLAGAATPAAAANRKPPPPKALTLKATASSVLLDWKSGGGSTKGFNVYRSTTSTVKLSRPINKHLLKKSWYTAAGLRSGTTYWFVVQAVNGKGKHAESGKRKITTQVLKPVLQLSNPEAVTGTSRFVMSRMSNQASPNSVVRLANPDRSNQLTWYRVHDVARVRVKNTGNATARITGITSSDVSTFATTRSVPFNLAPGASTDIPVRFVYLGDPDHCNDPDMGAGARVCTGSVTIAATGAASKVVSLAGVWQPGPNRSIEGPEVNYEPRVVKVLNQLYGFKTDFGVGSEDPLDSGNASFKFSADEVSSRFWRAANATKPVTVRRLSANTAALAAIRWYPSSDAAGCSTAAQVNCHAIAPLYNGSGSTDAYDPARAHLAQSVLPVPLGGAKSFAFSPGSTAFGLQLDFGFGTEFTDHLRNNQTNDVTLHGCTPSSDCGQHVRLFQLRNASGAPVANTYIVVDDVGGLNNDFNDNVLLVSNIARD